MRALRSAWLLARPGNAVLAALGVVVGGFAFAQAATHWDSLVGAALAAFLGVAGGNALNDFRDQGIDARAHPGRAIPRGLASQGAARGVAAACLGAAVGLAALTNPWVLLFALLLVLCLLAYERRFKDEGLAGNFLVSYAVGGTFLLGALAAPLPPLTYDPSRLAAWSRGHDLLVPLSMSALALLANLAREVYKDVVDADHDRGVRRTLPLRRGPDFALRAAGACLWVAIAAAFVPYFLHVFGFGYVLLVAPGLGVFAATTFLRDAARAALWTKAGMTLCLGAFGAVALL